MTVRLNQVDSVPLQVDQLSEELKQWMSNLVMSLNSTIQQVQNELNSLDARVTALGG